MRRRPSGPGGRWRSGWRRALFAPIGGPVHRARAVDDVGLPFIGWIYYLIAAHTTWLLWGMAIFGVAPALFVFSIGYTLDIFRLGFAVMAWTLVGMGVGYLFAPRLQVRTEMPDRVECGRPFRVDFRARNLRRVPARDVGLETCMFPDPVRLRLAKARIDLIPPGGERRAAGEGIAKMRGVYRLPPQRYDSAFPFGIWRWGRSAWAERRLHVYPRFEALESLDLPLGVRRRQDLDSSRQLAREALEFHACREFRTGDSLRHVHPRSSARLGVPVVKEFQAEGRGRTALMVDTWRAPWPIWNWTPQSDPVEGTLSLAAAVVDALARTDRVLELLAAGPGVYRFVSAGRLGYEQEALDILAAVDPCARDPLDTLAPILLAEIREIQSVCLLLTRWDTRRAELVEQLEAWEVGLKVVLVSLREHVPPDLPPHVRCVSARAVRAGEVVSL